MIPQFTTTPQTTDPDNFATDMDTHIAELSIFIDALNAQGALYGVALIGTSTSSVTVGTGDKTLTVETGLAMVPGAEVFIANTATPSNRMLGTVKTYDTDTGEIVVTVSSVGGSGTFAAWTVAPTTITSFDSQTFTDLRLSGKITEEVYALSGSAIDPSNGSIQTKTLSANTTFTESLASGQSVLLLLTASSYSVIWPTTSWFWGEAPTLPTTGVCGVMLFKVSTTLYGIYIGGV